MQAKGRSLAHQCYHLTCARCQSKSPVPTDHPDSPGARPWQCFHTARTQQQLVMDNFHEGTSEEIIVILPKPLGVVLQIGDEQDPIRAGFVVVSSITPGGNVARHGKIAVGDIILSIADPASKTTGLDSSAPRYCVDTCDFLSACL